MWITALIVIFLINSLLSSEIFGIFEKCKINDQACLKSSINNGLPKLANGLQTINLPPIDPYFFGNSVTEANGFLQEYFNVTFIGFSNIDVLKIEIDLDVCHIKLDFGLPKIVFDTLTHWKGALDNNQINFNLFGKMYCDNNTVKTLLNCKKVRKSELDYIEIIDGQTDFYCGNVTYSFADIVDGKPQFNKNITDYVNKNPESELQLTKPVADKNLELFIQFVANKIFSEIPLSELFLK
ncbi:hypothetical protein FQR65_LT03640 [Abscondita terminalis]|nr:hypothetical protein FQR65_LT03640 [Abscondita terminalis]